MARGPPLLTERGMLSAMALAPTGQPPSIPLTLSVIFGLPIALWAYKCLILVIFQRKMIYMGYVPLGARSRVLEPGDARVNQLSIDVPGEKVTLQGILLHSEHSSPGAEQPKRHVIIYFQGNAGTPLQRISVFQSLSRGYDEACRRSTGPPPPLTILAVAPRSYWSSTNRTPTQRGLVQDYRAVLDYAISRWPEATITFYGHSLGGAIATCLLAELVSSSRPLDITTTNRIQGLILENPFTSIPEMVRALYPSRWMPYYYLGPFVWDRWEATKAMEGLPERLKSQMLVLNSEKDEVVPITMGEMMAGTKGRRAVIKGALHEDAWRFSQWRKEVGEYMRNVGTKEIVDV